MIGGNTEAILQQKNSNGYNEIGEAVQNWTDAHTLWGWLDYTGGDAKHTYNTKLQETTHVFVCGYVPVDQYTDNKRMIINDQIYDVLLIDDPMGLHQQLEIYLRYVGR